MAERVRGGLDNEVRMLVNLRRSFSIITSESLLSIISTDKDIVICLYEYSYHLYG